MCLCGVCSPLSVCEVVAVLAVTVMHVLLFVLHVCVVRLLVCEGDGEAGVGSGIVVVTLSSYMGGKRGSGVLSSARDVLEINVGGEYDMCM